MTAFGFRSVALATASCLAACGCATSGPSPFTPYPAPTRPAPPATVARPPVAPASHQEAPQPAALPSPSPLSDRPLLTAEDVVRAVLERNPTLERMRAAAEAAAARYPQVTSLDDPMFALSTAPGSAWSPNVDYAARVEFSQKLLYPGKRGLKGTAARAEAAAAAADIDDTRLQLVEAAVSALADYYLAERATEVARENARILTELRQNAEAQARAGKGLQQDINQAEVELARQEERLVALRRARQVAVARLNTLMHLPPDRTLPPPAELKTTAPLPDPVQLRTAAVSARPDVRAAADRLAAEEAALHLALKEYNPDVDVMAAYDGFWQGLNGRPLQWQVGARVNLPVRTARRVAAVAEAKARVVQRRAELARLTDRVNFEVQEAFEQLRESEEVVRLYESKVLPAADANVREAQAAYTNNRVPFLTLVEAQRGRVALRDRYYEAVAETSRRRAALERAAGVR